MNPYRIAEHVARLFVALYVVVIVGCLAWVITVNELWRGVGIGVPCIAGFFVVMIVYAEWPNIVRWWCRKRDAWDAKRDDSGDDS